jgi:hypothetical protein
MKDMSHLHTEHFEETQRETQDERGAQAEHIADYVRSAFPKVHTAALEATLKEGLLGFRDDVIDRISESILKCPSPTTDADLGKLEYYIREFTTRVEEALTPLDNSNWEELGRAAHDIFKDVEGYYLETTVELEGLDDDERDAVILSKFRDAYEKFLDACDEWTTLTVAQSQLDAAKGKLIRQIDMIYFLK